MAVTLLVTAEEARTRLALQDLPDTTEVLESALVTAQLYAETFLATKFDPVSQGINIFKCDIKRYGFLVPEEFFKLKLKRGFVEEDSVTLELAMLLSFPAANKVTITSPMVDLEKGVVYCPAEYDGYYARVTYDSGFNSFNLPPDWLKEAILSYLPLVLNAHHITSASGGTNRVVRKDDSVSHTLLTEHSRVTPFDVPYML